jgi:hypothetical protein
MNNQTKVVLGVLALVFGISLIARFVVLSQVGMSGVWIFYLGLPIGGVLTVLLLLLRLGVLNFGESHSGTVQHWQDSAPATAPARRPWAAPTSQRLQELEDLHTSGAISDVEYGERRARIIAEI